MKGIVYTWGTSYHMKDVYENVKTHIASCELHITMLSGR